jgi:hypothetical protein
MMSDLFAVAFLISASASQPCPSEEGFPIPPRYYSIVQDAKTRWAKKDHSADPMRDRVPFIVELPRERCVILQLRVPNIGGSPAYCYDLEHGTLVEALEDIE